MRSRVLLLPVAVAALAVIAVPADARPKPKPKPVCNILKDVANDAGIAENAGGTTLADANLDITSVDLASDGKMLTGVIRVRDLTETDDKAPTGRSWTLATNNGTAVVSMSAYLSPFGPYFSTGNGAFDYAKNEIRIHVAVDDVAYAKIAKGSVLRNIVATSTVYVGFPPGTADTTGPGYEPLGGTADRARDSFVSYKVGTLSCVKVGP